MNKEFLSSKYHSMLVGGTISSVLMSVIVIADTLIAGLYYGDAAASSINMVMPIPSLAGFFAMVFSLVVPILYSKKMGAFKKEEADSFFKSGLTMSIVTGIILFLLVSFGGNAYLASYGVEPQVLEYAEDYLKWMKYVILLMPLNELLTGMVYADGDELVSTTGSMVAGLGKVVLSIPMCKMMGVEGLGFASFFCIMLAFLIQFLHFFRKGNSLRLRLGFSVRNIFEIIKYSFVDAGTHLFIAIFTSVMNRFVVVQFGSDALVLVCLITMLKEIQLVFDGIGEAMTPIMGVYLGEKNYPGIREIYRLTRKSERVESLVVMGIQILIAPLIVYVLGIKDSDLAVKATWGLRLMSLTLFFNCRMYLDASFYIMVKKIPLGIVVSALRDLAVGLPLTILGGVLGGIYGMFAGLMISPIPAYFISRFIFDHKYGRENYPLFFEKHEQGRKQWYYQYELEPDDIIEIRDKIGAALSEEGCDKNNSNKVMMLFEEMSMLTYEKNIDRKVLAECFMELGDNIRLIIKDDGVQFNVLDVDQKVTSFRTYVLTNLVHHVTTERRHLLTLSYNRNTIEV